MIPFLNKEIIIKTFEGTDGYLVHAQDELTNAIHIKTYGRRHIKTDEELLEFIKKYLKIDSEEWISVKEKMPPLQTKVLIAVDRKKSKYDISTGHTWGVKPDMIVNWRDHSDIPIACNCVTHWRHLPEPPKIDTK